MNKKANQKRTIARKHLSLELDRLHGEEKLIPFYYELIRNV